MPTGRPHAQVRRWTRDLARHLPHGRARCPRAVDLRRDAHRAHRADHVCRVPRRSPRGGGEHPPPAAPRVLPPGGAQARCRPPRPRCPALVRAAPPLGARVAAPARDRARARPDAVPRPAGRALGRRRRPRMRHPGGLEGRRGQRARRVDAPLATDAGTPPRRGAGADARRGRGRPGPAEPHALPRDRSAGLAPDDPLDAARDVARAGADALDEALGAAARAGRALRGARAPLLDQAPRWWRCGAWASTRRGS